MFNLLIQPDLQTRESVMVAAGRVQLSLTDSDGNVRYIKIEAKAKDLPGSSKRYTAVPFADATHVFISEKGYGTTRLGTYYPKSNKFYEDLPESNGHIVALKAAVNYVNGLGLDHPFVSIEAESQCGLCGHKLEDPISVQRGIGPDCAQKPTGSKILHASAFAGEQTALDTEAATEQVAAEMAAPEFAQAVATVEAMVQGSGPVEHPTDAAEVEIGVDVRTLSDRQIVILKMALAQEVAIRSAKSQDYMGHLAEVAEALQS